VRLTSAVAGLSVELPDQFDGFFLGVRAKNSEAADHFFGFGERSISDGQLAF
jgi:hypothetical protein